MLARARAEHLALLRAGKAASTSEPAVDAWQPVGPLQVYTPAWNLVTGRVTGLAADPSDTTGNTVYVGTTGGGVWKSTNAAGSPGTATFTPLTDNLAAFPDSTAGLSSLSIGAVSVQPGGTGVILAGTGDPNDATDSWYGVGLLRSPDRGNSWSLIANAGAPGGLSYNFFGNAFAGLAWSGTSPDVVVAAVSQSEYGAVLGPTNQQSILGLYYSSDAGVTWQLATVEDGSVVVQSAQEMITLGNAATAVVWNPIRKSFYAAIRYHGYYQSADGITWTRLANQPGTNLTPTQCPPNAEMPGSPGCPIFRGALAVQPVTGDLFALTVDQNNLDQGLWQDACNLTSGACASPTVQFATQIADQPLESVSGDGTIPEGIYNLALAAVPAQQDTLLFAGVTDLWRCSLAGSCAWRNTTNTQTCAAAQVAPAQHAIDATFGAGGLFYFGNDGGLWRSTDAVDQQQPPCSADDATHFQNLNGGLGSLAEVESFSEDPNDSSTWLAALGSLGTAAPSAGAAPWNQVLNGEGNVVAIDPVNSDNWYATSIFGVGINQCTEGTACTIAGFGGVAIGEPQVEDDVQSIPAPWILDPQDTANMILGTCRVWRGSASGVGWSQSSPLSGILDGGQNAFCDGNSEIRTLAAGVNDAGADTAEQIYAGMAGALDGGNLIPGHVLTASVTSNSLAATTAWVDDYASPVTNSLVPQFDPGGFDISSIYVDPHDPTSQTIYVTVQALQTTTLPEPVLYGSTDGGAQWLDLTANLPHAPANSVLVDPNNANIVYVALDTGVYYTLNVAGCASPNSICWNVFGTGLPNAPVTALMAYNAGATQVLRAATYGRGIWQTGLMTEGITPTAATVAPPSLTFALQTVQTVSAAQTVTVTGGGTLNLNISSVAISGDFNETDTCAGASLAPGSSCQIQVTFDPSQSGTRQGSLSVFANVTGGQLNVALSGTGLAPGAIVLTPSSLSYAATAIGAATASQSIDIANTGGSPVALTSETVGGDFAITANTCTASLAAQTSCEVAIDFQPTASGTRTGFLTVTDALGTSTAPLSGTGQAPATDTLSPSSLSFAAQTVGTTSSTQQVTLTNSGDQALTEISVAATGNFTILNNCGSLLQGHASCALSVAFLPAVTGPQSGEIRLTDEFRTQTVSMTGVGIAPPGVSATPASMNFGGLGVGTTSTSQTVTLANSGGVMLTAVAATISGPFAIAGNNCAATLAVGATCGIGVTFTPSTAGALTGRLEITAGNLTTPLFVALTGSGVDFSITVTGSSSAVVTSGQTASFTLELAGLSGSSGTVALACSGAPQNASCSLNPTSVAVTGSNTSSATLAIATGVAASSAQSAGSPWKLAAPVFAMIAPLGWIGLRRRKLAGLAILLLAPALLIPTGCGVTASGGSGSGSGSGGGQNATPPGNYVITVTATMDNITHSTAANLSVQ
ncbi:MAG TPA: choice-of-anchor D domain-containing protein [Acidobacteriaceae bacterium]|nr:choice-of-anchor D domain-containing protein [Acidobacteriaceae bacterium]